MMNAFLIYCDVDIDGNILEAMMGVRVIPERQYDYFFYSTDQHVYDHIELYKVDPVTRQLVLKPTE